MMNHRNPSALALILAVLAWLVAGCSGRYVITTTGGTKIITPSKPRLVESRYEYKQGTNIVAIPAMRVRVIEPYSRKAAAGQRSMPELR